MSNELYYLDEHGNKQDAALHEEMLREHDEALNLRVLATTLRSLRTANNKERFLLFKGMYDAKAQRHNLAKAPDLREGGNPNLHEAIVAYVERFGVSVWVEDLYAGQAYYDQLAAAVQHAADTNVPLTPAQQAMFRVSVYSHRRDE